MGKWTPEYYDDVLHAKMRSMITASIMRAKLDKSEPAISYEHFVEQLDSGDSFTASVMDMLVKEVADRNARPNQRDRRLIASHTAQTLNKLASPLRVYRPRSAATARRSGNLATYLTRPHPQDFDEVDMDEFESTVDSVAAQESARYSSSALHDSLPWARRWQSPDGVEPAAPVISDETTDIPRPHNWRTQAPRLSLSSSLSRQSSTHRAPRLRTMDFRDFTSRRRSSLRETLGTTREGSTEPGNGEGSSANALPPLPPYMQRDPTAGERQQIRRFFPFSRSLPLDGPSQDAPSDHWSSEAVIPLPPPRRWQTTYPISASPSPPREATGEHDTDALVMGQSYGAHYDDGSAEHDALPRLRRGGLGAPEVLAPRTSTLPWGNFGRMIEQNSPEPPTLAPASSELFDISEDLTAYPTPPVMSENDVERPSSGAS
ncbi:hypothetical protein BD626DRAFT_480160 [Schizophyllum amplum]|uniref:Uncharacterized protein n=1 Tax=Schizophyllum amplum TaxID=97359 RepID=A0A550CSY9_9AGAR|nr:hypothetical protein BD626DRAFT_480160 [Auriculariopsis ampla]